MAISVHFPREKNRERERERERLVSNMGPFPRGKKHDNRRYDPGLPGSQPVWCPEGWLGHYSQEHTNDTTGDPVLTNCQIKGGKRGRRRRGVRGESPGPVPSASRTGGWTLSTQATSPTPATRTIV